MVFKDEQYKRFELTTKDLGLYGELFANLGKDHEKGDINILLRRLWTEESVNGCEFVLAHEKGFTPAWETRIVQTYVNKSSPINLATYEFTSRLWEGSKNKKIIDEYCRQAILSSDSRGLERDIHRWRRKELVSLEYSYGGCVENYKTSHSLRGWIRGPVRNALSGYFDLRDNIGKSIGVNGTLTYQ